MFTLLCTSILLENCKELGGPKHVDIYEISQKWTKFNKSKFCEKLKKINILILCTPLVYV